MEIKNVIINKTFEVPMIITTQKVISVPDFTNLTTAINNNIKAENERQEKENAKYGDMSPKSMMRNAQSQMPKMLSMNIPKMPSFGH